MDNESAIVIINIPKQNICVDLEIPLNITANELVGALNTVYDLGIDFSDINNCYLKSENPIALLRGNKLLSDYGIRNGSMIYYTE